MKPGDRALLNLSPCLHSLEKYFNFRKSCMVKRFTGAFDVLLRLQRVGLIAASDMQAYDSLISRMKMPHCQKQPQVYMKTCFLIKKWLGQNQICTSFDSGTSVIRQIFLNK